MSASAHNEPSLPSPIFETPAPMIGGDTHVHRRISWAAIFGGVILVMSVQLVLTLLGAAIGLDTINLTAGTTPDASSLGIGVGGWWIITSVIALAFGGYSAAWLSGIEIRWDGLLHGLITWGITSLLIVYLLTSAVGGIVGGGVSALGGLASAASSGIKDAAKPVADAKGATPFMLQQQAQAYLGPTNPDPATMSAQDAQKEVATSLITYAKGGADAATAKSRIIAIMAAQQHISTEQAAKQFDDLQTKLAQAKTRAVQMAKIAADTAATAAAHTSFAAFAYLLIGAIAAAAGGSLAVQRRRNAARRLG
jgi:hypothetical protein